ncbi:hypothetical protein, partial [Oribacterium parvum]|uniref:hypothetical protein n=1 Tax=Oribacterium parvum TaxID=1501329 RepID=UPI0028E72FE8
ADAQRKKSLRKGTAKAGKNLRAHILFEDKLGSAFLYASCFCCLLFIVSFPMATFQSSSISE